METSLRIVLLLLAAAIIMGIVWDALRAKTRHRPMKKTKSIKRERLNKNPFIDDHHFGFNTAQDEFDDVILVKRPIADKPTMPEETLITNYNKDLVVLNVMARQPGVFLGKKLLDVFQEASLFYGDMDIFHRHENTDGEGSVMFSVASVVEPGIFDLSKMESFVTPGLTLFFQMERPNYSIAAFELMLRTAKQLAMRLDAEIKDDQHKFLTLNSIEKYRERMRHGMVAAGS